MSQSATLCALMASLLIGGCLGWAAAHDTVATECVRLGAFYVGGQVFRCHPNTPETIGGTP